MATLNTQEEDGIHVSDFRTPSHNETAELLIETVRMYPCLYDATDPGYRDKVKTINTWTKIARVIGFGDGKYLDITFCIDNLDCFNHTVYSH